MSARNPAVLGKWGPHGTRVIASESMWAQPLKWNRDAGKTGVRRRVFCASLADVFEDREELVNPRIRLFELIDQTPNLDWLLLTKRPEHAAVWLEGSRLQGLWPRSNAWVGVSVEDRKHGLPRVDVLRTIPAAIRFLSVEPLLEDLGTIDLTGIHWVIVGGESGHKARPMHPDWARSIRDQCQTAGVPFFFKQWGEWAPIDEPLHYMPAFGSGNREYVRALGRFAREHGVSKLLDDRPEGWDAAMIRDGTAILNGERAIGNVGKKAAGRSLDGREWSEFPAATAGATS